MESFEPKPGRRRLRPNLTGTRVSVLLSIAAIGLGTVFVVLALVPDIEFLRSETVAGTINGTSRIAIIYPEDAGLNELRLAPGNCTVVVAALGRIEWDRYVSTGEVPVPQLTCQSRVVGFGYPLAGLVIENQGQEVESYRLEVDLYAVHSTRSVLAFAGFPLLIAGFSLLVLRSIRREIERLAQDRAHRRKER